MDEFIARQPIFDTDSRVHGYELLFRTGLAAFAGRTATGDVASRGAFARGINSLVAGKRAFVSADREVLKGGALDELPWDHTIVEIPEELPLGDDILDACRTLKTRGYRLALGVFVYAKAHTPFLELVDYIKVDAMKPDLAARTDAIREAAPSRVKVIAHNLEHREAFEAARKPGIGLFQGFYFCEPVRNANREVAASKRHYLKLLSEVNRPALDFVKLTEVIERDMAFAYRLLKWVNSPTIGLKQPVKSVQQALTYLGEEEVRNWASLILMAGVAEGMPEELVNLGAFRAKFMELLAPSVGRTDRREDLFMMGLLSLIDAVLELPMETVLDELPLAPEVKAGLRGEPGPLFDLFDYTIAYERGNWSRLAQAAERLEIDESSTPEPYYEAIDWARQSSGVIEVRV